MSLSWTVSSYREILVKNRQFEPTSPLFGAPIGVSPWNYAKIFGIRKLESLGVVYVIPDLAVLVEHRLVTDRRTQDDGKYRASIASRG